MMKLLKRFKFTIFIGLVFIGLAIFMPVTAVRSSKVSLDYFKEMALILPPVFILMGLMEIWVPKNKIQKWLGTGSGIKGAVISVALGALPTGPLYVAFPMTASLLHKGASINNMVLFLGAWAALKIPQLMIEIKFLGVSFTLLRFLLTLIALLLVGMLMEIILRKNTDKKWLENVSDELDEEGPDKMKM